MKDFNNIEDVVQCSELMELIVKNYNPKDRMSICGVILETVADDTGLSIGEIYDVLKEIAEEVY